MDTWPSSFSHHAEPVPTQESIRRCRRHRLLDTTPRLESFVHRGHIKKHCDQGQDRGYPKTPVTMEGTPPRAHALVTSGGLLIAVVDVMVVVVMSHLVVAGATKLG